MITGDIRKHSMKKFKHEAELFKAALQAGVDYAVGRKVVQFEATDSASDRPCMCIDCWYTTNS
jgi:hypothetical protein